MARSTGLWVEDPLTLAVQIMHDAVAVLDMAGRVLVVNDRLLSMTGFSRSELIGAPWSSLIPDHELPDPRLGFVSVSRRAAEEAGSSEGAAVTVARKDGSTFSGNLVTSPLVSPQHGPVVVVAIGSVRKLTLEAIGFRGLLESAPDATIVLDARCQVVLGNSAAASLFGRLRSELADRRVEELFPRRHRTELEGWLRSCHDAARQGFDVDGRTTPFELEVDGADDASTPVEIAITSLWLDEGMLLCAAVRDVSRVVQLQKENDRLKAQLRANEPR